MKTCSIKKIFQNALSFSVASCRFLLRGQKNGAFRIHAKAFYRVFCDQLMHLRVDLLQALQALPRPETKKTAALPKEGAFLYSILIPVFHPEPAFLKMALESALVQKVSNNEVLIGFDGPQPEAVYRVVEEAAAAFPGKIQSYRIDREVHGGGISSTTNFLAEKASGDFLLLMDHDDWMHPDLLLKYDQVLQEEKQPLAMALYCDEYKIDENNRSIPGSGFEKPATPSFPYIFVNFICHCLLVSKEKWNQIGGLRQPLDGSQDFDLCLRLNLAGVSFRRVPGYLYAWRMHSLSSAGDLSQKPYAARAGLKALEEYAQKKGLSWSLAPGYFPTLYRALPSLPRSLKVRAILSGSVDEDLLKRCLGSLKNQENMSVTVTLLDGADVALGLPGASLAERRRLAIEGDRESDLFLFLDSSIVLEPTALQEMAFWACQPEIGAVGCRLETPVEKLFSAGLFIKRAPPASILQQKPSTWKEGSRTWEWSIAVSDAVYMGCCMVSRKTVEATFPLEAAHPFEEIEWARRLRKKGLLCLYTPFASGKAERDLSEDLSYLKAAF